ncbi:MAG TPA: hypothetical protein VEJ39_08820, partial [Candidatus Acidoferrales bacterium]|nr:hypothetical protein [Candidatus Acidoferrales bacterium]
MVAPMGTFGEDSVSLSPDAKQLARISSPSSKLNDQIVVFDMATNRDTLLTKIPERQFSDVAWTPDGRGLLVVYVDRGSGSTNAQIGYVSYPDGRFQSLTNDVHGYRNLSLSADGKALVSIQREESDAIYLQELAGTAAPVAVPGLPGQAAVTSVDWDNHANLIVATSDSLLRISPDGSQQSTLVSNPSALIGSVSMCRNGGRLVLSWSLNVGPSERFIWTIDEDGSHPTEIPGTGWVFMPICSPDGKWIYYLDQDFRTKRVAINGGTPELLPGSVIANGYLVGMNNLSADGKLLPTIAALSDPATHAGISKIALLEVNATSPSSIKYLTPRPDISLPIGFTPDGKAVAYKIVEQGVANVWKQPLDGSPGHRLTNFAADQMSDFRFSPDGKSMAVARQHIVSDVVLLRDTHTSQ